MPIKIRVSFDQKDEVKKIGAIWMPDEKTWVIPDYIEDINNFKPWLPKEGGTIVKRPYIIAKSNRTCWKCHKDTPLIALGAKNFFTTCFSPSEDKLWEKDSYPIFFMDISLIHRELVSVIETNFPFFKLTYSKTLDKNVWINMCINCQTIQPDIYNFERDHIFGGTMDKLFEGKETELLKLEFDYHIIAAIYEGTGCWINGLTEEEWNRKNDWMDGENDK